MNHAKQLNITQVSNFICGVVARHGEYTLEIDYLKLLKYFATQSKQLPPALDDRAAENATIHLAGEDAIGKGGIKGTALVQRPDLFRGEADVQ